MIEHNNFGGDMASFDKKTIKLLQNLHIYRSLLKFVFGCIPSFYAKPDSMKTNVDDNPPNPKWYVSTSFSFQTLITQHQGQLPLRHMAKK